MNRVPILAAASAALVFAASAPRLSARSTYSVSESALTAREIADALLGAGVVVEPAGTANLIGGGSNGSGIRAFSGFDWAYTNEAGRVFGSFPDGIVFSTGYASGGTVSGGTNTRAAASTVSQVWPVVAGDADLAREFPEVGALGDAAGVVFFVRPQHATLNIPLFVASEEFFLGSRYWNQRGESWYDDFSDCFAFFLSLPETTALSNRSRTTSPGFRRATPFPSEPSIRTKTPSISSRTSRRTPIPRGLSCFRRPTFPCRWNTTARFSGRPQSRRTSFPAICTR